MCRSVLAFAIAASMSIIAVPAQAFSLSGLLSDVFDSLPSTAQDALSGVESRLDGLLEDVDLDIDLPEVDLPDLDLPDVDQIVEDALNRAERAREEALAEVESALDRASEALDSSDLGDLLDDLLGDTDLDEVDDLVDDLLDTDLEDVIEEVLSDVEVDSAVDDALDAAEGALDEVGGLLDEVLTDDTLDAVEGAIDGALSEVSDLDIDLPEPVQQVVESVFSSLGFTMLPSTAIPEPSSLVVASLGLFALATARRR